MKYKLYNQLYTNDLSAKKIAYYRRKLLLQRPALSLYLVSMPLCGQGILEIYPYTSLLQKHFKTQKKSIYVLGIADSYDGAVEVARRLVADMYQKTGGFSVEAYVREMSVD